MVIFISYFSDNSTKSLVMSLIEAYSMIFKSLSSIYDEREAANLARILLEDAFGWKVGAQDLQLNEGEEKRLTQFLDRLMTGEPIQYVLGQADFYDLKLQVNPHVLVPRPETEELLHKAISILKERNSNHPLRCLDIGTGSGCLAVGMKYHLPLLQIDALDLSEAALDLARQNAANYNLDIRFLWIDILDISAWDKLEPYDFIISNPPYIPYGEKELLGESVKYFEPPMALFVPDEDPLLFYRHIVAFAKQKLLAGGQLLLEINEFRANEVSRLFEDQQFQKWEIYEDMQAKKRMVLAGL